VSAAENKAVFLSYASQDAEAAKRIADALRAAGVEVWFDAEGGLEHGDEWDAKIRRQIKECVLFIAVISANTQAREEGYFRIEWDLAAERARGIASGVAFILPVVIDDTKESGALVPDRFRTVQWTKLPGGNISSEVLQRFLKLWSHRTGALKQTAADPGNAGLGSARVLPASKRRVVWLLPLGIALLAAAGLVLWRMSLKPDATPAVAPLSAARQLAAKSRALLAAGRVVSRETLAAADDLAGQALKLDSTDAEVLATSAQVDAFMVYRGFDISEGRRQSAAKRAQRALALAPGSFEARHARAVVAGFLPGSPDMLAESEHIYRELWQERPADDVLGQELGRVLQDENHFADAAAVFLRVKQPLDAGWAYFFGGQFQEADKVADRLLAEKHDALTFVLKANVELFGFGDMAAAQAAVGQLTPTELLNDDAAGIALRLAVVQRDAPRILQLLGAFANPFVSIGGVNYPRQYWTGHAQQMLSHPEAARSEWHGALQAVEERLKSNSADAESLGWVAVLQALLGEKEAAGQALRLYLNYNPVAPGRWDWWEGLTILHLGGRNDEVLDRLAGELRRPHGHRMLYLFARSGPEFDPLRADPRLEALLRETLPAGMKPFTATTDQPAGAKVDDKSVAVLAFANLSDDKANEYFSDGISEELLNVLAKIPGLKVTARTSSFHFKGKDTSIPEIARQLGVAYVIEGSVRKSGDKVRITAQLIKAADDAHVWSDTFTRDLRDIFAVQDEIAGLVARNLQLKLGTAEVRREVDPEAHRLVLEGRHFWNLRSEDGFTRAEAAFRRAIALAPEFAAAHAGLADVLATRAGYRAYEGVLDSSIGLARTEAERAIALDPAMPEAYPALGLIRIWEGHPAEAEEIFRKALSLNQNYALPHHWLSLVYETGGRIDQALTEIGRAVALDPLSGIAVGTHGRMLMEAGRYADAIVAYERAAALLADRPTLQAGPALCLFRLNRGEEAVARARKTLAGQTRELRLTADAEAIYVLRRNGHEAEAADHAARVLPGFRADSYQRGAVLAALGRWAEAAPYLERTLPIMRYVFYWDPMWDEWRDDPRFQQLLVKLDCAEEYKVARETLVRLQQERKAKE
jgi:TolB-like protein/Tfp pilus assembly protein PilF